MLSTNRLTVVDGPETALPYHATTGVNELEPTINWILFDNLAPEQMVLIENVAHRFVRKMPGDGPHLFLNIERGEIARHSTTKLFEFFDKGHYYNPGSASLSFESVKSVDEISRADRESLQHHQRRATHPWGSKV